MDVEIIDLTIGDEEDVTTQDEFQDGQATFEPTLIEEAGTIILDDEEPITSISEVPDTTSKEYACLSIYSGEFVVDRQGVITDRQSSRQHLKPLMPSQPASTSLVSPANYRIDAAGPSSTGTRTNGQDRSGTEGHLNSKQQTSVIWEEIGDETLCITRGAYEKPRRLLANTDNGLFVVTMRGVVQQMSWDTPRYFHLADMLSLLIICT